MSKNQQQFMNITGANSSTRTSFGVNVERIGNVRPSALAENFPLTSIKALLAGENFRIGRHAFGDVEAVASPVNFAAGIPMNKKAEYVANNTGANLITSQTKLSRVSSNGRTTISLHIPYYDADAKAVIDGSQAVGAVAPIGGFQVKLEVMGGGILTGTSGQDLAGIDALLLAALDDIARNIKDNGQFGPLFAACGYSILPQ